jgi:hypothetical protein
MSCWAIRVVLSNGKQVFYQNIGENYNNAVLWMYENIHHVEAVLEQHIDDQPRVILEDVFVSEDN